MKTVLRPRSESQFFQETNNLIEMSRQQQKHIFLSTIEITPHNSRHILTFNKNFQSTIASIKSIVEKTLSAREDYSNILFHQKNYREIVLTISPALEKIPLLVNYDLQTITNIVNKNLPHKSYFSLLYSYIHILPTEFTFADQLLTQAKKSQKILIQYDEYNSG